MTTFLPSFPPEVIFPLFAQGLPPLPHTSGSFLGKGSAVITAEQKSQPMSPLPASDINPGLCLRCAGFECMLPGHGLGFGFCGFGSEPAIYLSNVFVGNASPPPGSGAALVEYGRSLIPRVRDFRKS